MITLYEHFISEAIKPIHADLIIVDVQSEFSKFFTKEYIRALFEYCKQFDRVYQVWDVTEAYKPTYTFPKQADAVSKEYGFNFDKFDDGTYQLSDIFLHGIEHQYIEAKERGFKQGDSFKTRNGNLLVYIGAKHKWFMCPPLLLQLFNKLRTRVVYMVGGADGECLTDVYVAAKACGVNVVFAKEYVYSAKSCPSFPEHSDMAVSLKKQKEAKKLERLQKRMTGSK